jgi:hypothetical protein
MDGADLQMIHFVANRCHTPNCEHLAIRDGRWVFLDFKGKGNKTRSVAVPLWVKQEIDGWLDVVFP